MMKVLGDVDTVRFESLEFGITRGRAYPLIQSSSGSFGSLVNTSIKPVQSWRIVFKKCMIYIDCILQRYIT